jgi:hypothetical protein
MLLEIVSRQQMSINEICKPFNVVEARKTDKIRTHGLRDACVMADTIQLINLPFSQSPGP